MHELGEIVQRHVKQHRQDQFVNILLICIIGYFIRWVTDVDLIVWTVQIVLAFLGIKLLLAKPNLSFGVSQEEIEELSDYAFDEFERIRKQRDRPILLSDLAALVRTSSKEQAKQIRDRQRAESERQMRADQEKAVIARRQKKTVGRE